MRLLVMVMADRDGDLAPVRNDAARAAEVTAELLGVPVEDVTSAAETDAEDDYWMTIPDDAVAAHMVAPATMQAYRPGIGLCAAATVGDHLH